MKAVTSPDCFALGSVCSSVVTLDVWMLVSKEAVDL